MSDSHLFLDEVREAIKRRRVTVVIGSGVSRATNPHTPLWHELIESAISRCAAIGATADWCDTARTMLDVKSLDMLVHAASLVHERLNEQGGSEFNGWLQDVFASLEPEDRSLVQALHNLNVPLVTTNYDDLIEQVTGLKSVTWLKRQRHSVVAVARGEDRRVLHLHGHWDDPDSVVLGLRSYVAVSSDPHTQAVMQALGATTSLLFVGCGDDGLADPNWGRFLEWLRQFDVEGGHLHRHYRLVRESEKFEPVGRLFPLVYGEKYDDLAPFLQSLATEQPDDAEQVGNPPTAAGPAVADAVAAYLERLEEDTAWLELIGLGRSLQVELPIAEAYVPLRTTLSRSLENHESDRFHEGQAEMETDVELADVFLRSSELNLHGVVLLGEPGAGKTTGARQLAWRLASGQSLPEDLGLPAGITPVLLRFRELSQQIIDDPQGGLQKFLFDRMHCPDAKTGLQNPGPELWDAPGGLLWILDGLDEIVDPRARRKVSGWIQRARRSRKADRFLVTCRHQGYNRKGVPLGPKFAEFHVRPLDDEQIRCFVSDWFAAAYGKLYGPGEDAVAKARDIRERLLHAIARPRYQTGRMRDLCTNPLLLTILCIVFHEDRKLPTERAELYRICIGVLLEHWRRELYEDRSSTLRVEPGGKMLDSESSESQATGYAEAAQSVLARMAWWMHLQQDRTAAPLDELAVEAEAGLAQVSASSGLGRDGRVFIDRMRDQAGILAMANVAPAASGQEDRQGACGTARYGFLHLSFQEYLAAEYAASEGEAKILASRAAHSWWRETALLSLRCSRPHCQLFFEEMLKAGIAEKHPDLAEQCLDEALFIPPEPFVNVLNAESTKPARRAAVLRLLRSRREQVPELEEIARGLIASDDVSVASLAREIVAGPLSTSYAAVSSGALAEPGAVWIDPRTEIAYVYIRAGEFMMGSESDLAQEWEKPRHRVIIRQPFWLARYPVTNAQYAKFRDQAGQDVPKPEYWDERRFNQPEQPVVGISWKDARAFAEWAESRLPTEAEWEYACRADSETDYCFGDDASLLDEYGWFDKNSGRQTQPVGAKKPNAWGLHDMHGNVWEWCEDWFAEEYYKSVPESDPQGLSKGAYRVFRGGCWGSSARYCRSASRSRFTPEYRFNSLGFRVARGPSGQEEIAEPGTKHGAKARRGGAQRSGAGPEEP